MIDKRKDYPAVCVVGAALVASFQERLILLSPMNEGTLACNG